MTLKDLAEHLGLTEARYMTGQLNGGWTLHPDGRLVNPSLRRVFPAETDINHPDIREAGFRPGLALKFHSPHAPSRTRDVEAGLRVPRILDPKA